MSTRKARVTVLAATVLAAALVTGTYAFTNFNQSATNKMGGHTVGGVRLHDDYNEVDAAAMDADRDDKNTVNKDVYVENYGNYTLFVRVRLLEYLERGYGDEGSADQVEAARKPLVAGAAKGDTSTWYPHLPDAADDPFAPYYSLALGGEKYYLPTDITKDDDDTVDNQLNYADPGDRVPTSQTSQDNTDRYTDSDVGYNAKGNDDEKALPHSVNGDGVTLTPKAQVQSLAAWLAADEDDRATNVWLYDTDGWYYWVGASLDDNTKPAGLVEGAVTGLLLDGVTLTEAPQSDGWYYAIHAELQAISKEDQSAFSTDGRTLTDDAWQLLQVIGGFSPPSAG
jgi:hypothetical protein